MLVSLIDGLQEMVIIYDYATISLHFMKKSLKYAGAILFNALPLLPDSLKKNENVVTFRKRLKIFLNTHSIPLKNIFRNISILFFYEHHIHCFNGNCEHYYYCQPLISL